MKNALKLTATGLCLALVFTFSTWAQTTHPLEGTYNVTASSSELGTLNFAMTMKRDGDKWKAEIKDAPMPLTVTSISVEADNKVTINADAGGSTVVIIGKLTDGKLAGEWTAGDMKGQWTGTKKEAVIGAASPTATSSTVSAPSAGGAAAGLEGTYDFKIVADGQGEFPLTLVIKRTGDKLVTEVPSAGDLNIVGIETKDPDTVNLTATYQGNGPIPLNGKRTGSEMGGKWEFGGFAGTWTAKKK